MSTSDPTTVDLTDLSPFIAGTENEVLAQLRAEDPLHWNDEPEGPGFWSVTRYDDVLRVVNDPQRFVNGEGTQIPSRLVEGGTPTVHNTDPPRHTALRRLASPHLRAVRIREWQDVIDRSVAAIVDDLEQDDGHEPIEFVHRAAALLPIQALGQVLGVPLEDCGLLLDWTNRVVSDDPEFMRGPDEKAQAREEMFAYFADLTERRRAEPRNDIVSKLAHAELDGEPLGWDDLAAYYFVLVGAGNETTRNLITGTVLAFHEFPGEWDKLAADPTLLRGAIEEMLRFVTPIRAMRRTAVVDVEWDDGTTIRAGDKVVCWFQAANRDPGVFEDPDTVRIDRAENDHVGFGWGIHACMGSHLARAEVTSFFTEVLRRGLRIVPQGPPDRLHTNQFHAFKRLPVRIEREAVR